METNSIPENIKNRLPEGFCLYSFDVSEDRRLAVISGCSGDPDFPELWIYDSEKDDLVAVDNEVLMDFPLAKLFFAENSVNVVATPLSWTPVEPMLIELSSDNYEVEGCASYDRESEHFIKKSTEVTGIE